VHLDRTVWGQGNNKCLCTKYNRELLLGLHLCTTASPKRAWKSTYCICATHPQPLLSRSSVCDFTTTTITSITLLGLQLCRSFSSSDLRSRHGFQVVLFIRLVFRELAPNSHKYGATAGATDTNDQHDHEFDEMSRIHERFLATRVGHARAKSDAHTHRHAQSERHNGGSSHGPNFHFLVGVTLGCLLRLCTVALLQGIITEFLCHHG